MTEAYSNPLQTIIDEFKTLSPETTAALIFKNNDQPIANTKTTSPEKAKKLVDNFGSIVLQAETIGGIENLTIQGVNSRLNISVVDNFYLVTVSSRAANQEVLKSLTQVVVPTVVRLIAHADAGVSENQPSPVAALDEPQSEEPVPVEEKSDVKPLPEPQPPFEPALPKTPIKQFMVEKIAGLLVPADTVRIDGEVIAKWSDLYNGKQITMVNIEGLDGKKTTCKFKAIKETKNTNHGIIQIPEKILQTLQIEKGKLVMVKPVIE